MMIMNLTLAVNDLEASMLFYREILGLPLEFEPKNDYFIVSYANMKIVFQAASQLEQQHPAFFQHLSRSTLGAGVQLELTCPQLDTIAIQLENSRWPIIHELDDRQHQRRELWIQDPDGYLLVLNKESF